MVHPELTPAQHAAIRRHIALIPAYIWAIFACWTFSSRLLLMETPGNRSRDFLYFYTQGLTANARRGDVLYDIDAQAALLSSAVPGIHDVKFHPVYGPQISIFFAPLARLGYDAALRWWLVLTVLVAVACGWALWRVSPGLRDRRWLVAILLCGFPALHSDLAFAQATAIGLVCVTAGFLALRSERPFLAGLALGSLAYKPPLGLLAAFIFIFAREWRIVLGAIAAAAIQLTVVCLFWGVSILGPYIDVLWRVPALATDLEPLKHEMHSWRTFFELLGLSGNAALTAYALTAGLTAVLALACWRARGPLALRYSAFLVATVLVDPHVNVYDLLLLLPAFVLLWNWILQEPDRPLGEAFPLLASSRMGRWPFRLSFQFMLYACYFAPLSGMLALHIHLQVAVLAHALLFLVVATQLRLPAVAPLAHGSECLSA